MMLFLSLFLLSWRVEASPPTLPKGFPQWLPNVVTPRAAVTSRVDASRRLAGTPSSPRFAVFTLFVSEDCSGPGLFGQSMNLNAAELRGCRNDYDRSDENTTIYVKSYVVVEEEAVCYDPRVHWDNTTDDYVPTACTVSGTGCDPAGDACRRIEAGSLARRREWFDNEDCSGAHLGEADSAGVLDAEAVEYAPVTEHGMSIAGGVGECVEANGRISLGDKEPRSIRLDSVDSASGINANLPLQLVRYENRNCSGGYPDMIMGYGEQLLDSDHCVQDNFKLRIASNNKVVFLEAYFNTSGLTFSVNCSEDQEHVQQGCPAEKPIESGNCDWVTPEALEDNTCTQHAYSDPTQRYEMGKCIDVSSCNGYDGEIDWREASWAIFLSDAYQPCDTCVVEAAVVASGMNAETFNANSGFEAAFRQAMAAQLSAGGSSRGRTLGGAAVLPSDIFGVAASDVGEAADDQISIDFKVSFQNAGAADGGAAQAVAMEPAAMMQEMQSQAELLGVELPADFQLEQTPAQVSRPVPTSNNLEAIAAATTEEELEQAIAEAAEGVEATGGGGGGGGGTIQEENANEAMKMHTAGMAIVMALVVKCMGF